VVSVIRKPLTGKTKKHMVRKPSIGKKSNIKKNKNIKKKKDSFESYLTSSLLSQKYKGKFQGAGKITNALSPKQPDAAASLPVEKPKKPKKPRYSLKQENLMELLGDRGLSPGNDGKKWFLLRNFATLSAWRKILSSLVLEKIQSIPNPETNTPPELRTVGLAIDKMWEFWDRKSMTDDEKKIKMNFSRAIMVEWKSYKNIHPVIALCLALVNTWNKTCSDDERLDTNLQDLVNIFSNYFREEVVVARIVNDLKTKEA